MNATEINASLLHNIHYVYSYLKIENDMIDIILGNPERSRVDPLLLNTFFNNNLQFCIKNTFNKQLLKDKMLKGLIT